MRQAVLKISLFLLAITFCIAAQAEGEAASNQLVLGMVNDQSGPNKNLGLDLRDGAEVFFDKLNKAGGINGRKIHLVVRDDKYDPMISYSQTKDLLEKENVFALIGAVGTATSKAVQPIVTKHQIPFLMPFTGGDFLRTPFNPLIFPERASYEDEGEALVHQLVDVDGVRKIGLFTQADGFGEAAKQAVYRALAKRGLRGNGEGMYARGSIDVKSAIKNLMAEKPAAVILFSTLEPTIAFLKEAKTIGFAPTLAGASPINYTQLTERVGADANGMMFADSIPMITDTSLPIVREYLADMAAVGHTHLSVTSLEGYLGASLFSEAARRAGKDVTRESLRKAYESFGESDYHGVKLNYTSKVHQGITNTYVLLSEEWEAREKIKNPVP